MEKSTRYSNKFLNGKGVKYEQLSKGSTNEPVDAGHGNGISQDSD